MHFTDLNKQGKCTTFVVRITAPDIRLDTVAVGTEVELTDVGGLPYLRVPETGQTAPIEGKDNRSRGILDDYLQYVRPRVAWVEQIQHEKNGVGPCFTVSALSYSDRQISEQPMSVHVDRILLDAISLRVNRTVNILEAVTWLKEQFLLPSRMGTDRFRIILRPGKTQNASFLILGLDWSLRVIPRAEGGYSADSLIRPRHDPDGVYWLLDAPIAFGDFPDAQDKGIVAALDALRRNGEGYIALWHGYQKLEWEGVVRRAKEFGHLQYSEAKRRADGCWEFILKEAPNEQQAAVARGISEGFAAGRNLPEHLLSDHLPDFGEKQDAQAMVLRGECERLHGTVFVLRPDQAGDERPPHKKGYLFLDFSGNAAAIKRREEARLRIAGARTGVPVMQWLEGLPTSSRGRRRYDALSPAAKMHFGPKGPTDRQRDALDFALNTPDIALIQGPPGTGKTRTIAALLARLSEIAEEEGRASEKNLLTSFQHDAVENAAAISGVNGLPAIKIGRKRGRGESTLGLETWRSERLQYLKDKAAALPTRPRSVLLSDLKAKQIAYLGSPGPDAAAATLLREILANTKPLLSFGLEQETLAICAKLQRSESTDENLHLLIQTVRGLRTSEVAFSDDGSYSAHRLLKRLTEAGRIEPVMIATLDCAKNWADGQPMDFLPDLLRIQERLLDELASPKPQTRQGRVNVDVAGILDRMVGELTQRIAESPDEGLDLVSERLIRDLSRTDGEELKQTLGRYTVILAATCQQSVSKAMTEQLEEQDDFVTVIVDEAARANPLDLMIPLSRARRRIVLVGDHRQLPHMLEPDIERELDKTLNEATRAAMKESLFQRLFTLAKEQSQRDGIERCVTLDAQFRMHPVLGRFVSKVFYERHSPDERFDSPGDPAAYRHPLGGKLAGRQAAWKDLPLAQGREERAGTSWRRPAEARWVAEETKRILDEHPHLSVGVITFYSAQVASILESMLRQGLAERDGDGGLRVSSSYEQTMNACDKPIERLRVGTVDAFQGKEFDVVILSMTRANAHLVTCTADLRRKFGHLLLENRLCVAMSRQRQLIMVVGDRAMLSASNSLETVPGLTEFLHLCQGAEGVVL